MRINFPGGPTAAALEESDMGCLGGALLIDTNNNTNDNGDNSQVWIFRNQLYPRGPNGRNACVIQQFAHRQLIPPQTIYYPSAYRRPTGMTAEKMLQALDEDRLYLPADVLSASLASSGAEQDMDWAIEAGCRLQASQTDRGSILLHAQDNVIDIYSLNDANRSEQLDIKQSSTTFNLSMPIMEVKLSSSVRRLLAVRTLAAVHFGQINDADNYAAPSIDWQAVWPRPPAQSASGGMVDIINDDYWLQPVSMDCSQYIPNESLLLYRRPCVDLVDLECGKSIVSRRQFTTATGIHDSPAVAHSCLFGQHARQCTVATFNRLLSFDLRCRDGGAESSIYQTEQQLGPNESRTERLYAIGSGEADYLLPAITDRHVMLFDRRFTCGRPVVKWPQPLPHVIGKSGAHVWCKTLQQRNGPAYLMQCATNGRHENSVLLFPFTFGGCERGSLFPPSAGRLPLVIEPVFNASNCLDIVNYGLLPKLGGGGGDQSNHSVDITPPIKDIALISGEPQSDDLMFFWQLADGSLYANRCSLQTPATIDSSEGEPALKNIRRFRPGCSTARSDDPARTLSFVEADLSRVENQISGGQLKFNAKQISLDRLTELVLDKESLTNFRQLALADNKLAATTSQPQSEHFDTDALIEYGNNAELIEELKQSWINNQPATRQVDDPWPLLSQSDQPPSWMITQSQPVFGAATSSSSRPPMEQAASQPPSLAFSSSQPLPVSRTKKRKSGFR